MWKVSLRPDDKVFGSEVIQGGDDLSGREGGVEGYLRSAQGVLYFSRPC